MKELPEDLAVMEPADRFIGRALSRPYLRPTARLGFPCSCAFHG